MTTEYDERETLQRRGSSGFPSIPLSIAADDSALLPPKKRQQDTFAKVERAKQEWEVTADALPELICLVDDLGRIIRANRTVETWRLGSVRAVQGVDVHELAHPHCHDPACYLSIFLRRQRAASDAKAPTEMEAHDPVLDRDLLISYRPLPDHRRGGFPTAVVVLQDVTRQCQAETQLRRYNQRLQGMNEIQGAILAAHSAEEIATAALSRIRRLVPFHQARVILFDSDTDEFLVLTADANGSTHLRPGTSLPRRAFLGNPQRNPERFFITGDLSRLSDPSDVESMLIGEQVRGYCSIPLVAEGEFVGCLSLASYRVGGFDAEDVEVTREVADLVAIATRQAQLYRKLMHSNAELEEALHAKDEMLQNVSHELRTPLFIIKGYVELLRDGALGALDPEQAGTVSVLECQADRLLFMVNQLLTLKAFDAAALRRVALHLGNLLDKVVVAWKVPAGKSQIGFVLDLDPALPLVRADPDLLTQVLYNLVDNAVKFSSPDSQIVVRAGVEGSELVVSIADHGIGIPADKLGRIFERFYQVEGGLNRRYGGMGIGLAICQSIVQAHGGRIWADSAGEGQGSTFYLALPIE